ncbi:MAG TPA: T9SS type A sorting domain-containing protein [Acidobacteriota bacterium]|nr:T9SS type A sorting domain-containing protein [Acidobacteriota bacterium]
MTLGLLLGLPAVSAPAQHMFLDTNGDAVHDEQDFLSPATTTIDVYLDTNHRRDGSDATRPTEPYLPLTINSYEVVFRVMSGSLTYGAWTDAMGYYIKHADAQDGTDRHIGWGSPTFRDPGRYRLGALSVSGVTSDATLDIVPTTSLGGYGHTMFGSGCFGNDFDNTLKLGSDWFDTDGTTPGGDAPRPGAALSAALSPNPIHPSGSLTFLTTVPGRVRVSLFDLQGRLVRRHLEDANSPAGRHDVTIDGLGDDGAILPSGVYFYRIEAVEGTEVGRVIVAR